MEKKEEPILLDYIFGLDCGNFPIEMALEDIQDGNVGASALYHLDYLCKKVFQNLPIEENDRQLYRFTSFPSPDSDKWNEDNCPIINDIKEKSITLSSPKNFNDPMDPLIKAWVERRRIKLKDEEDKKLYELLGGILDKIRICCLVDPSKTNRHQSRIEDCSPLMWAHYAKNHTGICIQYNVKPSNLKTDENNEIIRLLDINYKKSFPLDGNIPFTDSIVVKGNCWSYENEVRLVMYSSSKQEDYYPLKGYEISAIYMGYRIDAKKRRYLKKLLYGSNIKLYQMSFSKNDITKLESHEVWHNAQTKEPQRNIKQQLKDLLKIFRKCTT